MTEKHIFSIEQHNVAQLHEMQTSFAASANYLGVVSDIDETLIDTVGRHIQLISRGARLAGFSNALPSYNDVIEAGGTHKIYADTFNLSPEEWEKMMERIRGTRYVNEKGPLYHPELAHVMASLPADLIGYLTARPGDQRTFQTTEQDLVDRLQLPKKPIIMRPTSVDIGRTAEWKLSFLSQIAEQSPGKRLVLIDDSISTAKALAEHNSHADIPILQVLYKGPLTQPVLEKRLFVPDNKLGIYDADWKEIPAIMDEIKQTW